MFKQEGVWIIVKAKSEGYALIPTCKVVDAGGAIVKVKVRTSHVIVELKSFVKGAIDG